MLGGGRVPLQPFAPTVLMTADLGLSEHALLLGTSEYMKITYVMVEVSAESQGPINLAVQL